MIFYLRMSMHHGTNSQSQLDQQVNNMSGTVYHDLQPNAVYHDGRKCSFCYHAGRTTYTVSQSAVQCFPCMASYLADWMSDIKETADDDPTIKRALNGQLPQLSSEVINFVNALNTLRNKAQSFSDPAPPPLPNSPLANMPNTTNSAEAIVGPPTPDEYDSDDYDESNLMTF